MSLIVPKFSHGIKSLRKISRLIIKHHRCHEMILWSHLKILHCPPYQKTTKKLFSDLPRNENHSVKTYKCLICGKDCLDEKRLTIHLNRTHMPSIMEQLRNDPMNTYMAIFGSKNFKSQSGGHLDFKGALTVQLEGKYSGLWRCWTDGKYGGPIKAIMRCNPNLTYHQAVETGAKIASRLKHESKGGIIATETLPKTDIRKESSDIKNELQDTEKYRILAAQSLWQSCKRLRGSLAEKYLVKHRCIPQDVIPRLAFKFLPRDTLWSYTDYDKNGEPLQVKNYNPALIVPVKNKNNELCGVQRIFLDRISGGKSKIKSQVKFSKGVLRGGAGIVQFGQPNELLFLAEGPETGASIASIVAEKCPVLVSLSIMNFDTMAEVIHSFKPKMVVLAADNDAGKDETHQTLYLHAERLEFNLKKLSTVPFKIIMPDIVTNEKLSADWNDVLMLKDHQALRDEFWHKVNIYPKLT